MDNGTCKLQELSNMQLKITSIFKDLMREKNEYKQKLENLNKKLEQFSDETQNLKNEAETLKNQNKTLTLINDDMKNLIHRGIKIFKTLNLSQGNLNKEDKIALETMKRIFLEFSLKAGNSKSIYAVLLDRKEKNVVRQNDKEIKKKFEGLHNLNFCSDFLYDEEPNKNSPKKEDALKKDNPDAVLKTIFQNTGKEKNSKEPKFSCEAFDSELVNTTIGANIFRSCQPSPETERHPNKSPVFKDFGVRKQESLYNEENRSTSPTSEPVKLINEKFLEISNDFIRSPWKNSPSQNKSKSPSTPKRVKRQLKIISPDKSPMLKKSNNREAEISFLGVRKLRQTFLNVSCYKRKGLDHLKIPEEENENFENMKNKGKDKTNVEDDFISGSPPKLHQDLENIKSKKSGQESNDVPFITPPQTLDTDLDETYISSSILRKCNLTKHELERGMTERQSPLKRHAREKSPEYDSVSFMYKREPVRKKAERMKLPGHACAECNKYYENAFDNIGTQDLKKVLNKCSRHRDKNSPSLDDTPPGYWKPFLTCSTIISPNKNDTS